MAHMIEEACERDPYGNRDLACGQATNHNLVNGHQLLPYLHFTVRGGRGGKREGREGRWGQGAGEQGEQVKPQQQEWEEHEHGQEMKIDDDEEVVERRRYSCEWHQEIWSNILYECSDIRQ